MKDIGILTFHDTSNFGAILQAYATYKTVCSLGYSAEIIDYQNENIRKREIPIERHKKDKRIKEQIKWILRGSKEVQKYDQLIKFLQEKALISNKVFNKYNFQEATQNYKTLLVGSDMLWCTRYTLSDYSYMLDGIEGCKKVSYATSVGYKWDEDEEDIILELLSKFDSLAVRENDTADYLSARLGKKVHNVCDPTMLISLSEWEQLVSDKTKDNRILVYMDDPRHNCSNTARKLAQKNNSEIKRVGFQTWPINRTEILELYSIQEFLSEIYRSASIVTASYHGLLFAIYFHIPFIYFNKDSSRMSTLAERLSIGYRDGNKYNVAGMKDIDWDEIDKNVENFRMESMSILKGMLSD